MATRPTQPRSLPADYDPERPYETPAQMAARVEAENATKGRPMTPEELAAWNSGPLGFVGDAFKAVGGAVGDVAGAVINVAGSVVDVAVHNPITQAAAAVYTGGLSLAAQAGIEAATGAGGPVTRFFNTLATDPLEVLKAIPGAVLTEGGLIGTVADVASYAGAATQAAFGPDSKVGRIGGAVYGAVEDVQQAAKDDPVASLQVIAGVALTAFGVPAGRELLTAGASSIVGGAVASTSQQNPGPAEAGELEPAPSAFPGSVLVPAFEVPPGQLLPAASDAAGGFSPWALAAGAAAVVGAVALTAWLVQDDPTP